MTNDLATALARLAEAVERLAANGEGLDPGAAAAFCGVSRSKWHQMNADGYCPLPAEMGDRCPRWTRTELRAWMIAGAPSRLRWQSMRATAMRTAGSR